MAGLQGRDIQQVAIGGWHCLAVDSTGQAYAWGGNEYGQCGVEAPEGQRDVVRPTCCLLGTRVRQVAAGGMHSLALTETGEVSLGVRGCPAAQPEGPHLLHPHCLLPVA